MTAIRRSFQIAAGATGLARIPLLPADVDGYGTGDPALTEGMFLASRTVDEAHRDGERSRAALAATKRSYELRARLRPTPNGVFAGVAAVGFAPMAATLRLGSEHRARTNPSAGWLAAVSARLIGEPAILSRLRLTTNNLVIRRGARVEHERQAAPGEDGPERVTIRATSATELILQSCRAGATVDQLISAVQRSWPNVAPSVVETLVAELTKCGFLLTDLLPDDLTDDPLGHLLSKVPTALPIRTPLVRLHDLLTRVDRHRPGEPLRLKALRVARELADAIAFHERPFSVDTAADANLVLPSTLAQDAADAANLLWQISTGDDPLAAFHDRFLERYGRHRLVPLLDVIDPAVGFGLVDAQDAAGAPSDAHRTSVLTRLLTQAIADGRTEVVLDAATVTELTRDHEARPPRTAEIYVRVLTEDATGGGLLLAVCPWGGSQDAGSTLGRFARLLADDGPARPVGPRNASPIVAEIVARPRVAEAASLAPPTGLAPQRIPVGVPSCAGDLSLEDLMVASDGDHLMLWSALHDRPVMPVLYSRLSPHLLPPLARFLQMLGHAGSSPWHGWSWDLLSGSAFLPRVRYGRTVLSSARWRLPDALIAAARRQKEWDRQLAVWRTSTTPLLPDIVVTDDGDRRLPLDLRRVDDRELLRRYVRRGLSAVTEQPGGPDAAQGVIAGQTGHHMLELIVPLVRTSSVGASPRTVQDPVRPAGAGQHLPGGEWLSLAVRGPMTCHEQILHHLAAVAADVGDKVDRWFWLRYDDAHHGPHLRVRFHGDPMALGSHVLPAVSRRCAEMMRQRLSGGFTVEPYDQEIERYGGPETIGAAESVFAADSQLVLATLTTMSDPDRRLVAAAVAAFHVAAIVADGELAALPGRHLERATRRRFERLRLQVRSTQRDADSLPVQRDNPAWITWHDALLAYHDALRPERRASCASSMIHMHTNRLFGRPDAERLVRALAADLLALSTHVS